MQFSISFSSTRLPRVHFSIFDWIGVFSLNKQETKKIRGATTTTSATVRQFSAYTRVHRRRHRRQVANAHRTPNGGAAQTADAYAKCGDGIASAIYIYNIGTRTCIMKKERASERERERNGKNIGHISRLCSTHLLFLLVVFFYCQSAKKSSCARHLYGFSSINLNTFAFRFVIWNFRSLKCFAFVILLFYGGDLLSASVCRSQPRIWVGYGTWLCIFNFRLSGMGRISHTKCLSPFPL